MAWNSIICMFVKYNPNTKIIKDRAKDSILTVMMGNNCTLKITAEKSFALLARVFG